MPVANLKICSGCSCPNQKGITNDGLQSEETGKIARCFALPETILHVGLANVEGLPVEQMTLSQTRGIAEGNVRSGSKAEVELGAVEQ